QVDSGLHLNLTEGTPISSQLTEEGGFQPLVSLLIKAYFRQLSQAAIEAEFHAQLDQFVAGRGRLPDFIDGHQHIHQFPIIRDALLTVYEKRLKSERCYVRAIHDKNAIGDVGQKGYIKNLILQLTGARQFKKQLLKNTIPHNSSFAGIYSFAQAKKYADIFPYFLKRIKDKGLIMCHPGLSDERSPDAIATARAEEYHYFLSDDFLLACQTHQVIIERGHFGIEY
ncbi:MAG TPA: ChbG/HpnK family deacetylase, partial [Gammaproteobacteria bacterium]|nr:ChbG/HpnK family deacetylase [Gammaproteobacteria bacterium]